MRVRFTVRRMMVLVAGVAFLLGAALQVQALRTRAARYSAIASQYRAKEFVARIKERNDHSRWVEPFEWKAEYERDPGMRRMRASAEAGRGPRAENVKRVETYAALARKYERAARYPWLPVDPDPPEPR